MRLFTPRPLVLCGALLAAGMATASLAQPAPAPGAPPAQGGRMMRHDPEARIERLRAALQLRPDQEPALRAFVDAVRPPEGMRQKMQDRRQEMAGLTTPERLDRMRAHMAERQAAFDRRAAATKRFYAQLSPTQQKAFDALRPMHGGRPYPFARNGG